MSRGDRTLNDDFEEDDLPGGSLDLEKGSAQVGSGVSSSYDEGGIDFDDELRGDDGPMDGALELDMPDGGRAAPPPAPPLAPPILPDLELDVAPGKAAPARTSDAQPAASSPSSGQIPPAPPSDSGAHLNANASGQHPANASQGGPLPPPAKPTAAAIIANYPAPPTKVYEAPMYTARVVLRQLELRSELESLRRRRSPDVVLYEAALTAYEPKTFRLGMAISCAALAVATFLFFLPVILRFMRD